MIRTLLLLTLLLAGFPLQVDADDQAAIALIEKAGGSVRPVDNGWEVEFHLTGRDLRDEQLVHVAKLKGVTRLNLRGTKISSAALVHLKGMTSLELLHLERTAIDDDGTENLAGLANLEYLNLYGTQVTDKTLDRLTGLKKLKRLYVWKTDVTDAGVAQLEKNLPGLRIVRGVDLKTLPADLVVDKPEPPPTKAIKFIATNNISDAPKSMGGDNIEIVFQNKSPRAVKIVWVGYDGNLKLYGELDPGGTRRQNTYANNCWLITDKKDEPIGYFICGPERALAVIAK